MKQFAKFRVDNKKNRTVILVDAGAYNSLEKTVEEILDLADISELNLFT